MVSFTDWIPPSREARTPLDPTGPTLRSYLHIVMVGVGAAHCADKAALYTSHSTVWADQSQLCVTVRTKPRLVIHSARIGLVVGGQQDQSFLRRNRHDFIGVIPRISPILFLIKIDFPRPGRRQITKALRTKVLRVPALIPTISHLSSLQYAGATTSSSRKIDLQ